MMEHVLDYWRAGGPLMPVLALISFIIWYSFLRLRGEILDILRLPRTFENDLLKNLSTRRTEDNLKHYVGLPDVLSKAVAYVLGVGQRAEQPSTAYDQFQAAYQDKIDREAALFVRLHGGGAVDRPAGYGNRHDCSLSRGFRSVRQYRRSKFPPVSVRH